MDEGLGAKEVKMGISLFNFIKKGYAEFTSRGSTKRAQEFLNVNNNKREKFSRKTCEVPLKSIHCQIEESINDLESLKSLSSIEKDNKQASELIIQECFKAFSPQETYLTTYKKKRVSNINSLFFSDTKYREEFNVEIKHASTSLKLDIDALLKSNNEFLTEKELLNIFEDIVNKLFYGNIDINSIILSGDIGTGKTTLFSKIMQEMISKNKQGNSYYILPINIDFEKMISVEDRQAKNLAEYVDNLFVGLNKKIDKSMSNAKDSKEAKNQKIMPIVFFDNLDLVYQKFCEDYFVTPNGVKFIDIFLNLIEKVLENEKKYLLVCALRGESLNAIKNRELGNKEKLHLIVSLLLEVKNKTSVEIKSIIEKRLRLSAEGLRLIKSKSIELEILMKNIQKFKNTKIDFEELDSISSEGLRNTVDLFFRVSPSIHTNNIFNRFFIDNYYIKKMHFMGDTNVYTQAGNGIFNIFLNNTDFRYMEDTYSYKDSYISNYSGKHVKKLAKISYIHTYWAKYFILVYLYQEKMKKNITPLNKKSFINFFSKQSTTERYEENLVRLILLGLSESRHGKIIDISLNNTDTISKFSLSHRGKYILEKYIWSFDYLAVVVDDIWLEFPDFILEEFSFLQVTDQSYCHISNQKLFEQKRRENLSHKIKKVKLFLEVLKISYVYEKKKVKRIVERIKEKQNPTFKFNLPDFSKIENTISKTIKEYSSECNLELKDELNPLATMLSKKQQKKLKKFFTEQYALGIAYGKHDLANYHQKNIEEVSKVVVAHEELNDEDFDNNPNLFNLEKVE